MSRVKPAVKDLLNLLEPEIRSAAHPLDNAEGVRQWAQQLHADLRDEAMYRLHVAYGSEEASLRAGVTPQSIRRATRRHRERHPEAPLPVNMVEFTGDVPDLTELHG